MGRKLTFQWDEHNTRHLTRHAVSREEFEDVFRQPMFERVVRVKGEDRVTASGKTGAGRYLFLAYTMREGKVRAITAYTLPRSLRKVHDAKKENL